jgi:hypothetical protein
MNVQRIRGPHKSHSCEINKVDYFGNSLAYKYYVDKISDSFIITVYQTWHRVI